MDNEIIKPSTEVKSFQTLPVAYKQKKTKGKPYAFYSYSHYEVYPGDVFYAIQGDCFIFARATFGGRFEPFGLLDLFDGTQELPYDDVIDMTLKALPMKADQSGEIVPIDKNELLAEFKKQMLMRFSGELTRHEGPDYLAVINERCSDDKAVELKFGFFRRGSIDGQPFTLPEKLQNETYIVMNGLEKTFMEPYFEIDAPSMKSGSESALPAPVGAEKLVFRKIFSLKDFYNLLDQGKPDLLLCADSIRARVAHPYLYIPPEWVNGTYECMRGTKYDINQTYWFFAQQFVHNIGMSIVNLKQQMMPYYQKYHHYPIPKDLRREDVLYLCTKWFVQDPRDGLYYHLQPTIANDDGSYFCLDKKWFSLFHDRVRRYGKKTVCDLNDFKFRSSNDKKYFRLFSLDAVDLEYAFSMAIDILNFDDFYQQMELHFNPACKKNGMLGNDNPVQLPHDNNPKKLPG